MREKLPEGLCQQMPEDVRNEYFDTRLRAKTEMARRICFQCIVRDECLEMVLDTMPESGVYAGMTADERTEYKYGGDVA